MKKRLKIFFKSLIKFLLVLIPLNLGIIYDCWWLEGIGAAFLAIISYESCVN